MLQKTRKEEIINLLKEKKECKVDDLCRRFGVSLSTIHRDLNELEREGRIQKIHGGVLLNVIEDIETRNTIRLRTNVELKKRIANKALKFVENGDCLFLDNSTTCYYFAKALSESKFQDLLVITNSYLIPGLFLKNQNIQVVSTGGQLLKEFNCFVGPCAIAAIDRFNGDKFFLSTAAISIEGELSDTFRPESDEVKREMYRRSREHICLVDSTKFGRIGQSRVFSLSEIDKIITDSGCSNEVREEFARIGKELIIA
ncbi:MAG: DeoR/GlpR transcriptional regulator [Actinobacteria bacterium]|nr:DeoR/GlpR transcriptional regulator [Actinomycetota bacterium]